MAGDISSYSSLGLLALACALHSLRLRRRHTYFLDAQLAVYDKEHGFHSVDRLPNYTDSIRYLGFGPGSAPLSPLIYLAGRLEILSVSSPAVRRIANHSQRFRPESRARRIREGQYRRRCSLWSRL